MAKKRTNNKMRFVKFILNDWENKIVPSCSEPHGTKWLAFQLVMKWETVAYSPILVTLLCQKPYQKRK